MLFIRVRIALLLYLIGTLLHTFLTYEPDKG